MERETLDRILEIQLSALTTREIDGVKYMGSGFKAVLPNVPDSMEMESLTGIIDFVAKNREAFAKEEMSILVRNQSAVCLYGKMGQWGSEAKRFRPLYVQVIRNTKIEEFPFREYLDHETFIIKLMTQFVWTPELTAFIAKVRTLKSESSVQTDDNGTVNKVTRKDGIDLDIPREIISLQPYRTFPEVEQPKTPFIFRATLKSGEPSCALLECDGGAWLNQARTNIKAYLEKAIAEKALGDIPVFA